MRARTFVVMTEFSGRPVLKDSLYSFGETSGNVHGKRPSAYLQSFRKCCDSCENGSCLHKLKNRAGNAETWMSRILEALQS